MKVVVRAKIPTHTQLIKRRFKLRGPHQETDTTTIAFPGLNEWNSLGIVARLDSYRIERGSSQ
jgi:hypothetical protein